jgi:signal transduction histidine kinase
LEEGPKRLSISSERLDSELSVTVEDSGKGVAPEDLERVFDTFYSTKADGLGVGLSICRAIIEAHRGRLTITPATPRGARFQFVLPTLNAD